MKSLGLALILALNGLEPIPVTGHEPSSDISLFEVASDRIFEDRFADFRFLIAYQDYFEIEPDLVDSLSTMEHVADALKKSGFSELRSVPPSEVGIRAPFVDADHTHLRVFESQTPRGRMRVSVLCSALTKDHAENLRRSSEQKLLSQAAREFSETALSSGVDGYFMVGHARVGGGDFHGEMVNTNLRGKTDLLYYIFRKPGVKLVEAALSTNQKPPLVFGCGSCKSTPHFLDRFRKALGPQAKPVLWVGTNRYSYEDEGPDGMIEAIRALKARKSTKEFLDSTAEIEDPFERPGLFDVEEMGVKTSPKKDAPLKRIFFWKK